MPPFNKRCHFEMHAKLSFLTTTKSSRRSNCEMCFEPWGPWSCADTHTVLCTHSNCRLLFQASYNPRSSTGDKKQSEPLSSLQTPWVELLFAGVGASIWSRGWRRSRSCNFCKSFIHVILPQASIMPLFCRQFTVSHQERLMRRREADIACVALHFVNPWSACFCLFYFFLFRYLMCEVQLQLTVPPPLHGDTHTPPTLHWDGA